MLKLLSVSCSNKFFCGQGTYHYAVGFAILRKFKSFVEKKNITESEKCIPELGEASKRLGEDVNMLMKTRPNSNENLKLRATYLDIMVVGYDLLRADHEATLPHIKRSNCNAYTIMLVLKIDYDPENEISLKPDDFYDKHKEQFITETSWKAFESD